MSDNYKDFIDDITLSFDVYCAECDTLLEYDKGDSDSYRSRHTSAHLTVKPCPSCLETARQEGRDEERVD